MKETREDHPSFGMINVTRYQGGNPNFFGSSITHGGGIMIGISAAESVRSLNYDRYHAKGPNLIEIRMTSNQFVEMLTSMNTAGVPCTITRHDGKILRPPNFVNKRQQFESEFTVSCKKVGKNLDDLDEMIGNIVKKGRTTKKDLKKLEKAAQQARMQIESNLPFVMQSWNEQMNKSAAEAKGEVEAYVEGKIREVGLEELRDLGCMNVDDDQLLSGSE
jgi:hypothetical protein